MRALRGYPTARRRVATNKSRALPTCNPVSHQSKSTRWHSDQGQRRVTPKPPNPDGCLWCGSAQGVLNAPKKRRNSQFSPLPTEKIRQRHLQKLHAPARYRNSTLREVSPQEKRCPPRPQFTPSSGRRLHSLPEARRPLVLRPMRHIQQIDRATDEARQDEIGDQWQGWPRAKRTTRF